MDNSRTFGGVDIRSLRLYSISQPYTEYTLQTCQNPPTLNDPELSSMAKFTRIRTEKSSKMKHDFSPSLDSKKENPYLWLEDSDERKHLNDNEIHSSQRLLSHQIRNEEIQILDC